MKTFITLALLLPLALFAYMSRDMFGGWFLHVSTTPENSIRGEWVGHLDVVGLHDPYLSEMHKQAMVRFTLVPTDSFLKQYGGAGVLAIQGEAPKAITVNNVWPDKGQGTVSFESGLWLEPYNKDEKRDLVSGGYKGTLSNGVIRLKREDQLGYVMEGTLHKGSNADFDQLVSEMNQTASKTQ